MQINTPSQQCMYLMYIGVPYIDMMLCRMMFTRIIGKVHLARFPENIEGVVPYLVLHPMVSHSNGFTEFRLDGFIGNTHCRLVVGLDRCTIGWAWPISIRAVRKGMAILPLMYSATYSASEAAVITRSMIVDVTWILHYYPALMVGCHQGKNIPHSDYGTWILIGMRHQNVPLESCPICGNE